MKMTLALVVLMATQISSTAWAAAPCLRQDQIYNWTPLNDTTLVVEDDLHKKFKLTLLGKCFDLQYRERIGFKVFGGFGLSCVTRGDSILSGSVIGPQRCSIKTVELYTPDMEKADKRRRRPRPRPIRPRRTERVHPTSRRLGEGILPDRPRAH